MKSIKIFFILSILISIMACNLGQNNENPETTAIPTSTGQIIIPSDTPTQSNPTEQLVPTITPTEQTTPTIIPTQQIDITSITISNEVINETSETPKYTIDIDYPLTNIETNFNSIVEDYINNLVEYFKAEAQNAEEWRAEKLPEFGSDLIVQYEITTQENLTISVRFTISQYNAGAAHPNTYFHVINFDLDKNAQLTLSDLFNPQTTYLDRLASECRNSLQQQGVLEFEEGINPTEENFQNWNITENGLLISFPPYQIAPYALGPQFVTVPYPVLADILDPNSVLSPYISSIEQSPTATEAVEPEQSVEIPTEIPEVQNPEPQQINTNQADLLIDIINQQRQSMGIGMLSKNPQLSAAANAHSSDMANNNFVAHSGSDNSSPFDRINAQGYQYSAAAENVAAGYASAQDVFNGWMGSPGHKENMLNPQYSHIGTGIAYNTGSDYGIYWTAVFASP